jgi:hypothetical protein
VIFSLKFKFIAASPAVLAKKVYGGEEVSHEWF